MNKLGGVHSLLRDLPHHLDEPIKCVLGLCLRWLNHQRLFHDQWEVHRWRMNTKIDQTLGNVKCSDAQLLLSAARSHKR